ncbi:hypothetical protein DIPPA_17438 [Diplonema papillatum]|nr:hypothetical protein DIPPA_17438 [Diplonema papillatum]
MLCGLSITSASPASRLHSAFSTRPPDGSCRAASVSALHQRASISAQISTVDVGGRSTSFTSAGAYTTSPSGDLVTKAGSTFSAPSTLQTTSVRLLPSRAATVTMAEPSGIPSRRTFRAPAMGANATVASASSVWSTTGTPQSSCLSSILAFLAPPTAFSPSCAFFCPSSSIARAAVGFLPGTSIHPPLRFFFFFPCFPPDASCFATPSPPPLVSSFSPALALPFPPLPPAFSAFEPATPSPPSSQQSSRSSPSSSAQLGAFVVLCFFAPSV